MDPERLKHKDTPSASTPQEFNTQATVWVSHRGLKELIERREKIRAEIDQARQDMVESVQMDNDLRENPGYMALRTKLMYTLPRDLAEIEQIIQSSRVFEDTDEFKLSTFEMVQLGARVTLAYDDGRVVSYLLLGYNETNLRGGIISYQTPLGKAIMGKHVGDEATVEAPGGKRTVRITAIEKGL